MDPAEKLAAERRLELAFELSEDGLAIERERLRRERPDVTPDKPDRALLDALLARPQAPRGDAGGRSRTLILS